MAEKWPKMVVLALFRASFDPLNQLLQVYHTPPIKNQDSLVPRLLLIVSHVVNVLQMSTVPMSKQKSMLSSPMPEVLIVHSGLV